MHAFTQTHGQKTWQGAYLTPCMSKLCMRPPMGITSACGCGNSDSMPSYSQCTGCTGRGNGARCRCDSAVWHTLLNSSCGSVSPAARAAVEGVAAMDTNAVGALRGAPRRRSGQRCRQRCLSGAEELPPLGPFNSHAATSRSRLGCWRRSAGDMAQAKTQAGGAHGAAEAGTGPGRLSGTGSQTRRPAWCRSGCGTGWSQT